MPAHELQVRSDSQLFASLCSDILRRGHEVRFQVRGESMRPNLLDGDDVLVAPVQLPDELHPGDIALVENSDGLRVHRISRDSRASHRLVTRGDSGLENDPAPSQVLGRVVSYSRGSRQRRLSPWDTQLMHPIASFARAIYLAATRRLPKVFAGFLAAIFALALASVFAPSAHAQTADLQLTQTAAPAVVNRGSNITYTETVTNHGPNAATTPVVYQQTPPNTTFVSLTKPNNNWTCTTPAVGATGQVICTLTGGAGTLANGATANFTFVVAVNGTTVAGTTIVNSANATSETADSNGANNATVTSTLVEITNDADLSVTMLASPTPVFIFSTLTYQIQVKNYGLNSATTSTLTDTLPASLTFVSATTSQGTCTGGLNLTCNFGTIAVNGTVNVTITVTSPSAATALTNTASVTTARVDPVTTNNSATAITVVQPIVCATPGKDGSAPVFSTPTIVNTYYPPSAAGSINAGATSATLGPAAAAGAQTPIAIGDLLLVIQMQDAVINFNNSSSYGDGPMEMVARRSRLRMVCAQQLRQFRICYRHT